MIKSTPTKIKVTYGDDTPLSKQDFSIKVAQLSRRFNYTNVDHESAKKRFVDAVRRYRHLHQ